MAVDNGQTLPVVNTGFGILFTPSRLLQLKSIFHVPLMSANLLCVQKLASDNYCLVIFYNNTFAIQDMATNQLLFQGCCKNGLYPIPTTIFSQPRSLRQMGFLQRLVYHNCLIQIRYQIQQLHLPQSTYKI